MFHNAQSEEIFWWFWSCGLNPLLAHRRFYFDDGSMKEYLFVSTDHGRSWTFTLEARGSMIHDIQWVAGGLLVLDDEGPWWSEDRGYSWVPVTWAGSCEIFKEPQMIAEPPYCQTRVIPVHRCVEVEPGLLAVGWGCRVYRGRLKKTDPNPELHVEPWFDLPRSSPNEFFDHLLRLTDGSLLVASNRFKAFILESDKQSLEEAMAGLSPSPGSYTSGPSFLCRFCGEPLVGWTNVSVYRFSTDQQRWNVLRGIPEPLDEYDTLRTLCPVEDQLWYGTNRGLYLDRGAGFELVWRDTTTKEGVGLLIRGCGDQRTFVAPFGRNEPQRAGVRVELSTSGDVEWEYIAAPEKPPHARTLLSSIKN